MSIWKKLQEMPCTLTIIAVWIAVWAVVTLRDASPVLCGKGISKIGSEYYRIFTAGLTHTGGLHLIANVSALFWIGFLYERPMGSVWFALIGAVCAVMAQFAFLCIFRNAESSIGGSVYTFAFCGFGFITQFLVPDFPKIKLGTWSGNWIAVYCAASNIPRIASADASAIVIHGIAFVVYGLYQ